MILIKAEQKSSRQSPLKVRLVADAIRGLSINDAVEQLSVMDKKASIVVLKVLRQAVANATNNLGLPAEDLSIEQILVNPGPIYKRWRAVSRGRAHEIKKPTCHVRVVLKAKGNAIAKPAKKTATKASNKQDKTETKKADQAAVKPGAETPTKAVRPVQEKVDPRRLAKRANVNQSTKAVRSAKKPSAAKKSGV